jgi:hypothetical protein
MVWREHSKVSGIFALTAILLAGGARTRGNAAGPSFKYVGGTENVADNCQGQVQLTTDRLIFRCPQYTVSIPYASISLMQYRPDVAQHVKKMKLNWKATPPRGGGKRNRYFTVIYNLAGSSHAVVLEASPSVMRPYLAEIDLKAGKRVEVRGYEN